MAATLATVPPASAQNTEPAVYLTFEPGLTYGPADLRIRDDGFLVGVNVRTAWFIEPPTFDPVTFVLQSDPGILEKAVIVPDPDGQYMSHLSTSPDGRLVSGYTVPFTYSGVVWIPREEDRLGAEAEFSYVQHPLEEANPISQVRAIAAGGKLMGDSRITVTSGGGGNGKGKNKPVESLANRVVTWDSVDGTPTNLVTPGFLTSVAGEGGMSSDGNVVAGYVMEEAAYEFLFGGVSEAAVWFIDAEHPRGLFSQLVAPDGVTQTRAHHVSGDGSVVTGYILPDSPLYSNYLPFRWQADSTSNDIQILEGWNENFSSTRQQVPNDDGSVIVGNVNYDPSNQDYDDGYIWKSDGSQVTYLANLLSTAYPEIYNALNLATASWIGITGQAKDGNILTIEVDDVPYLLFLTPRAPQITAFVADNPSIPVNTETTVTIFPVGAVDPAGFLQRIDYYDDINLNGVPDAGELRESEDADVNGYAGIEVTVLDTAELNDTFQYLAVAVDTEDNSSEPAVAVLTVVDEVIDPDPVLFADNVAFVAQTRGKKTDLHVCVNAYEDDGDGVAEPGSDDVNVVGASVTVIVNLDGAPLATYIGATDSSGLFLTPSFRAENSGSYTATATLSKAGYDYDPDLGSNHDSYPD